MEKKCLHVGFIGTQSGLTPHQLSSVREVLADFRDKGGTYFHHGDCVGADVQAAEIARQLGYQIVQHPPTKRFRRAFTEAEQVRPPREFLVRNRDIVNECDIVIAAPKENREQVRSGTWATYRYARRTGKDIQILGPDPADVQ